ncbi:MAG: Holliday junction resolvase RuvX [Candidatus Moraniibacteriota bacterium]|nr:MAG: Holliday junction resolvase RuvX [Candidatus Moranbacteria bacterium]
MEQGNFLGIDWGKRKVGLAIASSETAVAVAYATIENNDTLFEKLNHIITTEEIHVVVIGDPQHQYREAEQGKLIKSFSEKVRQLGVQVVFSNEIFTSQLAQKSLLALGHRHVTKQDDAEAAKILLQGWLDQQG